MILCDAGGANSYRHHIFKHRLMEFATQTGLSIIVCHYPPYCSKWNPIEHRLFCHVHHAWDGTIFHNIQIIKERAELTSTKTGLAVKVKINDKKYFTKRIQSSSLLRDGIRKYFGRAHKRSAFDSNY